MCACVYERATDIEDNLPFWWHSFCRAAPVMMVEQLAMVDNMDLHNRDN